MSWTSAIGVKQKKSRRKGAPMRSITIAGTTYESIKAAMAALNCSNTKIYYLIGESYRSWCAADTPEKNKARWRKYRYGL